MKYRRQWSVYVFLVFAGRAHATTGLADIENALQKGQWDNAVEISHEILVKDSKANLPKIKGAYALFQKGYPNAALLMLKKLTIQDWRQIPQGQDRFAEIVALFQKKIPASIMPGRLSQMSSVEVAPSLKDEVGFDKGHQAFEAGDFKAAHVALESVSRSSRFFINAKYLLGTIAIQSRDYGTAGKEFSVVFEPNVYQQASEFWNDLSTQITSHWGANLKVWFDADFLTQSKRVGELAMMGLARAAYASQDYQTALVDYGKISSTSPFLPRADLEKIWTLLKLNRHEEALNTAKHLEVSETSFEAVEARTVRAIVLTDAGRTDEARQELNAFLKTYEATKKSLVNYGQLKMTDLLPRFLLNDLKEDLELVALESFGKNLSGEIQMLRAENKRLFPAYSHLASELEPLLLQSRNFVSKLIEGHVSSRLRNLEQLYIQAKLVMAETYLEDREILRKRYNGNVVVDESMQKAHDQELLTTLSSAIQSVDEVLNKLSVINPALEFRQSELLWELGVAHDLVGVGSNDKKQEGVAREIKLRALATAKSVLRKYPSFDKGPQVSFFAGFAEIELGRVQEGIHDLDSYIKAYPQHEHAPDANRILGDFEFDLNHFAQAETYYKHILEFQNSSIVGYALYKIAWCGYNQRDFAKALLGMEKAVTLSPEQGQSEQMITLKREARRDLISIYAEVGDHRKAPEYFKQFLSENPSGWLSELAEQLDRTGQFEKSRDIYRVLLVMDPANDQAITYRAKIIDGAFRLHDWNLVIEEAAKIKTDYGTKLGEDQSKEQARKIEEILHKVVISQLFEFEKTQTDEVGERTLRLNEIYLSLFKGWPAAEEPLYRHSRFLSIRKNLKLAALAHSDHWSIYKSQLKEPRREESLRDLVHALEQEESEVKEGGQAESAAAGEILKYTSEYLTDYPSAGYARAIAFLKAAMLFKYQKYDLAMVDCQNLLEANTGDEIGRRCFQNLRFAHYKKKNWDTTYEWATRMNNRADMKSYQADLRTIRAETMFLRADTSQDNLQAAKLYLQIASDSDFSRLKEKSLYNAFLRYQKADAKRDALKTAMDLERLNAKFPGLKDIRGARAAFYQEAGDYKKAWPLLKNFVESPNAEIVPEVLRQAKLNAALIAEALGEKAEAVALLHEFGERSPAGVMAGGEEAARILARLENKREAPVAPKAWPALLKEKGDFEKWALSKKGNLAERIKKGAGWLEDLSRKFLRLAKSGNLPVPYALESYCIIPHLYQSFADQTAALAKSDEVKVEISKVTSPMYAKAGQLAEECINKSADIGLTGDFYRQALVKWGWQKDAEMKNRTELLLAKLEARGPSLDADPMSIKDEKQIFELHLDNLESEASWYSLSTKRLLAHQNGLSRLTLIAARTKWPTSGRIPYALAYLEEIQQGEQANIIALYQEAAKKGAANAWLNLARYHLRKLQFPNARIALKEADKAGLFASDAETKKLVGEMTR